MPGLLRNSQSDVPHQRVVTRTHGLGMKGNTIVQASSSG